MAYSNCRRVYHYFSLVEVLLAVSIFALAAGGLSLGFTRVLSASTSLKHRITSTNEQLSLISTIEESITQKQTLPGIQRRSIDGGFVVRLLPSQEASSSSPLMMHFSAP